MISIVAFTTFFGYKGNWRQNVFGLKCRSYPRLTEQSIDTLIKSYVHNYLSFYRMNFLSVQGEDCNEVIKDRCAKAEFGRFNDIKNLRKKKLACAGFEPATLWSAFRRLTHSAIESQNRAHIYVVRRWSWVRTSIESISFSFFFLEMESSRVRNFVAIWFLP